MAPLFEPISHQIDRHFPPETHPYRVLEAKIHEHLTDDKAVLDIGCGRSAPNLMRLVGKASVLHGVDLVAFRTKHPQLHLHSGSVTQMPFLSTDTIDLAYSRSVMEHVADPAAAFREVYRVLRPGGRYIFLTPNFYDYGSLIAHLVPNAWHPKIVHWATGREEEDVFPTFYRANTRRQIARLARAAGLEIEQFSYLGQYPAYLLFSRPLFWVGSAYERIIRSVPGLDVLQGWILCVVRKPKRHACADRAVA